MPSEPAHERELPTLTASPSAGPATRTSETAAAPRRQDRVQDASTERYQIIGEHGRGGIGCVHRAHDRHLGRDVAIKELISPGETNELRFLREAFITARLEHPGIVPVHEAGRWPDGTPFYAMKLVAGRPLRELIAERTSVAERIGLLHHVIAVADAIAYAHGRQIIHRDIKPANVIVGEFGETIVIDWGLAKDLSASPHEAERRAPDRSIHGHDLTSDGDVMGTPAYMAPEQERGEQVDQRADVFAIGAMLWEICALTKTPPRELGARHRLLRRAGVDPDLITIIDKALARDPAARYPDAAALASDLKAFKAGSRIAARDYSVLAVLSHWTRRHRAVAISALAIASVALWAVVTYVRDIALEKRHVHDAESSLVLREAELLLQSDPRAALAVLQRYQGADRERLALLRAQARGLGVARLKLAPHTQAIFGLARRPDGALITVGADRAVAITSTAGVSRVVARDASSNVLSAYAEQGHVLAYACEGSAICLVDTRRDRRLAPLTGATPVAMGFSPEGERFAAADSRGDLSVWRRANDAYVQQAALHVAGAAMLELADAGALVAASHAHVELLAIDRDPAAQRYRVEVPDLGAIRVSRALQLIAASTSGGELVLIDLNSGERLQRAALCSGELLRVSLLARRRLVGYACQDGAIGTWDIDRQTRQVIGQIDSGATVLATSLDERYVFVGGNNGVVLTYDLVTRIQHLHLGHVSPVTVLLAPTEAYPDLVSADRTGELRSWRVPNTTLAIAAETSMRIHRTMVVPKRGAVIAIGTAPEIAWLGADGSQGTLAGHEVYHDRLARSRSRPEVTLYGVDDRLEQWTFRGPAVKQVAKTGHGTVTAAAYAYPEDRLVTGGSDGCVEVWSSELTTHDRLGCIPERVAFLRALPTTSSLLIAGASGMLWLHDAGGLTVLAKEPGPLISGVVSADSRWLALGIAGGVVRLYELATRRSVTLPTGGQWIDSLGFSPDGAELAIGTDRHVILQPIDDAILTGAAGARARRFELEVKWLAHAADGRWLAIVSARNGLWFYDRALRAWSQVPLGKRKVTSGTFSEDSRSFWTADSSGKLLRVDMAALLARDLDST